MPNTPDEPAIDVTTRPDHHGLGVKHPAEEKPKKRGLFRRLTRLLMLLIALAVLLAVLAPWLLSTGPGRSLLVNVINSQIEGEIEIDELELSWLGGQHIGGLRYTDDEGGVKSSFGSIQAKDIALFDLLTGSRGLGDLQVVDVLIEYTQPDMPRDRDAPDHAPPGEDKPRFTLPETLSGKLALQDVKLIYSAKGIEPVVLTLPSGTLDVPGIRDIQFDFDASLKQGERSGRVFLKGDLLNLFDPDGVIQPMKAAYDVKSSVEGLSTGALDQMVSGLVAGLRPGVIAGLLGEGELTANGEIKGTVSELSAEGHAQTPKFELHLYQERDGDTLIASPRSSARLVLDEATRAALLPESTLTLAAATAVEMTSLQFKLPRKDETFDWDAATAAIELKAGDNFALIDEKGEKIYIDKLRIGGIAESIADKLTFDLTAALSAVDAAGKVTRDEVNAQLLVKRPLDDERSFDFYSAALPIALSDALAGQDGQLVMWLGETLGLQAELHASMVTDAKGNRAVVQRYALRPEGRVTGEITGEYNRTGYILQTPDKAPVEAILVEKAFASLMEMVSGRPGEPALTIDKPMRVFVSLREAEQGNISIATDPSKTGVGRFFPDRDRTHLGVTIELTPASVYDPKRKSTYELRGGTIQARLPDMINPKLEISADLKLWVRPDAGEEGLPALLSWQTSVSDLLDTEGGVPLDGPAFMKQVALSGGVTLDHAPSGLLDSLLNRDGDIASVLGPVVEQMDARFTYADGQPTGATLKLNWDEKNNRPLPGAWASMKPAQFDIDANQVMTVRGGEDLELQVKVSEEFGNRWMGQLHPILFDAKSADRPVNIKINGKSFKFPLKDDSMKGANVEAEVDLGSVAFGENALLGRLLEWTGHGGERAVFEPAKVALVDGKISYDEFDLAVGNVRLRLDGEVDLVDGQIVDMAVRVPGESLIRVFNELDGIIPADDYLSIPMTGPIRQPQFDRKLITKEVTRLLTRGILDKQKDKLKDKLKDEIGIDKDQPGGEFIDGALDLIFGGKRERKQPDKEQ